MYQDSFVQEWLTLFDDLTSFSFMVYFEMEEETLQFLAKGLATRLQYIGEEGLFAIVHDTVDEMLAKALGTYRGTSFTVIFPGKCDEYEDIVVGTILEGLEFLRVKAEYLGITKVNDYV